MRLSLRLGAAAAAALLVVPALQAQDSSKTVRVGLMADFTGLPFVVAEKEGLFAAQGIKAELKVFRSAVERDAALQAGALDGCNADLVALMANRKAGFDLKLVASAQNRFSLLAGPALVAKAAKEGRKAGPADLAGAGIGLSANTVIEYVVDTLLADAGVKGYKKVDVPRIPVRLELLVQGKLEGASLPLPFDEAAAAEGSRIVADSVSAGLDPDLFMFYAADLAKRPETHRALWRAVDAARALIAADPVKYRPILAERLGFSDEQAASVAFPAFPKYRPTAEAETQRAGAWMKGRGLLDSVPAYADLVASGVLP